MANKINDDVEEYFSHFSSKISKDLVKYATNEVFKFSRYIFTRRVGKQQYGYCTHCHTEFKSGGLKHNETATCPNCKSKCIIKASGYKRSKLVDEAYFVYYEKSKVNPNAIVARGIYAIRDYRFDYHNVETQFETMAIYIFEPGKSTAFRRYLYFSYDYGMCRVGSWEKCSSIFSQANQWHIAMINSYYSRNSIKKAVKGTPFQYSCWESYDYEDMIKFFDLYAKYPCVEYLTKLGLGKLVKTKLRNENTYSAINWKGTTINKILRLDKQSIRELKNYGKDIDFLFLRLYQMSKKDGSNLPISAIKEFEEYSYHYKALLAVHKYSNLKKMNSYINKQYELYKEIRYFYSKGSVLDTWKDYIADCVLLEMNLLDDRILYPTNLHEAHQVTLKRVKTHENELLDLKIKKRLPSLELYRFEHKDLFIRPAISTKELIKEGKALIHCVGNYNNGYMTGYAAGRTNILLIRKVSEPDKPYFTMEISKDNIKQVHGYDNCNPNKAVKEFIESFKLNVLQAHFKPKKKQTA